MAAGLRRSFTRRCNAIPSTATRTCSKPVVTIAAFAAQLVTSSASFQPGQSLGRYRNTTPASNQISQKAATRQTECQRVLYGPHHVNA